MGWSQNDLYYIQLCEHGTITAATTTNNSNEVELALGFESFEF